MQELIGGLLRGSGYYCHHYNSIDIAKIININSDFAVNIDTDMRMRL